VVEVGNSELPFGIYHPVCPLAELDTQRSECDDLFTVNAPSPRQLISFANYIVELIGIKGSKRQMSTVAHSYTIPTHVRLACLAVLGASSRNDRWKLGRIRELWNFAQNGNSQANLMASTE